MKALIDHGVNLDGYICPGHVSTITGSGIYTDIAEKYGLGCVISGFEPLDICYGILETVKMLESGQSEVFNAYPRVVTREGNQPAQRIIESAYEPCDRQWRGIGMIPMSGWRLKKQYEEFDAEKRFGVEGIATKESDICISGLILQGLKKPDECPAFGTLCTPQNPLGATMVSSEGACAAYYRYGSARK